MHSAVLQNKGYIKFAAKNTVEVIVVGSIERAVEEKHRNAETYEAVVGGKKKQFFVKWPGIDLEAMQKLNRSKARSYAGRGVPHTSIVDPFTLTKVAEHTGSTSSKNLEDMVEKALKALLKEHGKPKIDRGDLEDVREAVADADEALAKEDVKKALRALDRMDKKAKKWPEEAKTPLVEARKRTLKLAEEQISAAEALVQEDPKAAKAQLRILKSKLRGTGLEERVEKALEGID
jgi:predicted  nucleic acid-binding Zn-ribbon protein